MVFEGNTLSSPPRRACSIEGKRARTQGKDGKLSQVISYPPANVPYALLVGHHLPFGHNVAPCPGLPSLSHDVIHLGEGLRVCGRDCNLFIHVLVFL